MKKIEFTKRTEEEIKEKFQSCRYCPMGPGIYKVTEGDDTYYLCEKHYQEEIQKEAQEGKE